MRRLTGDDDLSSEFATTWRTYDLDAQTTSLLEYAEKLTKAPGMIDDGDLDALRAAGWSEDAIYEASALISFFNFSGRMEAASGLPTDEVPASARPPEARAATKAPRWRTLTRSSARSGSVTARTPRPRG